MKKTSLLYSLLFVAVVGFMASCSKDDEAPQPSTPDECAAAQFPATTGTVIANFLNFKTVSGDFTTVEAAAGDVLSFAIQLDKTPKGNRPQKLKVYQSDCVNALGTVVEESIKLRNTDEQIKNVNYTVPTGMSTVYLNFEIEESGSNNFTYKRVKITVSGSGVIESHENIKLGGDNNRVDPSRLISATGQGLNVCNAAANIESVDITLLYQYDEKALYLTSNPARRFSFFDDKDRSSMPQLCGDSVGDLLSLDGGVNTKFTKVDFFDDATSEKLDKIDFDGTLEYIAINAGDIIAFKTSNNRVGLAKIKQLDKGDASYAILDVKVQR